MHTRSFAGARSKNSILKSSEWCPISSATAIAILVQLKGLAISAYRRGRMMTAARFISTAAGWRTLSQARYFHTGPIAGVLPSRLPASRRYRAALNIPSSLDASRPKTDPTFAIPVGSSLAPISSAIFSGFRPPPSTVRTQIQSYGLRCGSIVNLRASS